MKRLIQTSAPRAVFLIRLAVGGVFLSEGIQKFLYPAENGAGRLAKVGVPAPEVMGPFVGTVEIVCGGLIVVGLLTRLATIPLIVDILVAILTTKIPVLVGHETHNLWRSVCRIIGFPAAYRNLPQSIFE
ncbi:MAG TPA: DoxX family protein [Anaerolineales bacterium]|nr:DoxX family protein [Anaerolineales bacterium]